MKESVRDGSARSVQQVRECIHKGTEGYFRECINRKVIRNTSDQSVRVSRVDTRESPT